jgi:hypothetical protein
MPSGCLQRDPKGAPSSRSSTESVPDLRLLVQAEAERRALLLGGLQAEGIPEARQGV